MEPERIVYFQGQFIPASEAKVSIFDRSFCYGDGLFETVRVSNGRLFRWSGHSARLQAGAKALRIAIPSGLEELRESALELIRRAAVTEALLRIQLSRGKGPRGYSCQGANAPLFVMTLHEMPQLDLENPPGWRLITSTLRVGCSDPIPQIKSCNKLLQILARAEAEAAGAVEALLLNSAGEVAEAAGSNVFWIEQGRVSTPPLSSGALAGVTRAVVLELCRTLGIPAAEVPCLPAAIFRADGVFLTLSSYGIVEAVTLDGKALARSPTSARLRMRYQELLAAECGGRPSGSEFGNASGQD